MLDMNQKNILFMRTRITGGKLKGMVLTSSKSETLRPTLQMVRLAICSMFGNDKFNNIHMLDLYSGTGILGLEALSRGAKWVDFVEKNRTQCRNITSALLKFGFENKGKVYCADVERFITGIKSEYSLVTIDPPYADDCWERIMPMVARGKFIGQDSVVVAEHGRENKPNNNYGSLVRTSAKKYGDSYISIYSMGVTNG
jgi:16S rRNA (guanine966-N2)-methyltransferase